MTHLRDIRGFIALVLFMAWLDWIMHRNIVFLLVAGGGLIAAAVFRSRITAALASAAHDGTAHWMRPIIEGWRRLPVGVQRLLVSLAPLLYFLTRGQGTSGAGIAVAIAGVMVAVLAVFLGQRIDPPLMAFYAVRDRLLGRRLRVLLAPLLGVLIAFLVVHGSLLDLPALFGGTTTSPKSAVGLTGRFFLATLLAGVCTVLLLRESGRRT